ncbi:MAG: PAS domain-containing protein [Alphaproteobacteria bacterium]
MPVSKKAMLLPEPGSGSGAPELTSKNRSRLVAHPAAPVRARRHQNAPGKDEGLDGAGLADAGHLLDANPDAAFVIVGDTIAFANSTMLRLAGATEAGHLVGKDISPMLDVASRRRLAALRTRVRRGISRLRAFEVRLVRPNGASMDLECTGHPVLWKGAAAILVIAKDVTEQRAARRLLRESELRFRSVFDASPEPIYVRVRDRIVCANKAMAKLFGYATAKAMAGFPPRTSFTRAIAS